MNYTLKLRTLVDQAATGYNYELAPYLNRTTKEYWPSNRPRKPLTPVDKVKRQEIAAHNAEIDRIKAEKKARKIK